MWILKLLAITAFIIFCMVMILADVAFLAIGIASHHMQDWE